MKNIVTNVLLFTRSFLWLWAGPIRHKFSKILTVYKFGGVRFCWSYAVEKFGKEKSLRKPLQNQLSYFQSGYLLARCSNKPLFSIITPVYKVESEWLDKCICSVVSQQYQNWELILVDDASQKENLRQLMNLWALRDSRIRVYFLEQNRGIAEATNYGIKQAKGEFISFLDHDDELTPDALTWIVWTLNKYPDALWFYSDEDKISETGKYYKPNFKPDFSPEFLLSIMYTCHFSVYSASLIHQAGGMRQGFDGSQDHDLALRLSEIVPREKIVHIPRILYHWRATVGSSVLLAGEKSFASTSGIKAVSEALKRRNIAGSVTPLELCPTYYSLNLSPRRLPKVSIIIPTRNALVLLKKCLDSVRKHTKYPNLDITIIDNLSDDSATVEFLEKERSHNKVKIIKYDKPFNHSEMNNIAVESTNSEIIVLMNNDIEILSDNWLEQLVATMDLDESIGAVGGLLLYESNRVQHGGVIIGLNGGAGHAHKHLNFKKTSGYFGRLCVLQEFSAVTAALILVRKAAFIQAGGFDSQKYPTSFNDIDLCLRMRKNGFRCIYNPRVCAIHHETQTRDVTEDEFLFRQRFSQDYRDIQNNDPFYNPNLSLNNEQFHGYRPFPLEEQIPELSELIGIANHKKFK